MWHLLELVREEAEEGDRKKAKLDKVSRKVRKVGKEGTKGKRLNRNEEKRKRGGAEPRKPSHRGFKPGQRSAGDDERTEAVADSQQQKTGMHKPSVEEGALLDSDVESNTHLTANTADGKVAGSADTRESKKNRRYLLFAGNLPQSASREDVMTHFERRGVHISEFRLLSHKDTGKSKGCGFMEFASDKEMQNALKFHRSHMQRKCINVEVTCGGGGKSERRQAKIAKKNRTLRKKKSMVNPIKRKTSV